MTQFYVVSFINFNVLKKSFFILLLCWSLVADLYAQAGKDGSPTITTTNTVLNRYTRAVADVAIGSNTITVADINELNRDGVTYLSGFDTPANAYSNNALSAGDLLMLYQAQGVSINTSNDITYGEVTSFNGAGTYEFVFVESVSGNTITLGCRTRNAYFQVRYAQVIRVPQYNTLTVNAGASVVAVPWGSSNFGGADPSALVRRKGGIITIHTANIINNGNINANSAGFRGGTRENATLPSADSFYPDFVTTFANRSAEKGESVAGYRTDYDVLGGRYGRGAAANGGGGGNTHNAGGGGGANGGAPANWFRGAGVMNDFGTCGSPGAWALDPEYLANANALTISSGGGKGGYTFGANNVDACIAGPSYPANFITSGNPATDVNSTTWGGNQRKALGGMGGRPLVSSNFQNQIFFGGGGGAGDGNNNESNDGGDGGGIVFLLVNSAITGTGSIQANGENGSNTIPNHRDAPGGGGGGGTVIIKTNSIANTQTINANGGNGGSQLLTINENEGPGGGGGGGVLVIAVAIDASTKTVNGGANGITTSASLTEFPANGATSGNLGTINTSVTLLAELSSCLFPPNASNDLNVTALNTAVSGSVLTNDIDPNGGTLTVTALNGVGAAIGNSTATASGNGTITLNADGTYTYTPNTGFTGADSFSYTVCNTAGNCSIATVTITIDEVTNTNNPPLAQNDFTQTVIGQNSTGNVLSNDYDTDFGQILTVTQVNGVPGNVGSPINITGGTLTLNADGSYTFVPNVGFTGTASAIYQVCDNGTPQQCSTATLTIQVGSGIIIANNPPLAQDDVEATYINTIIQNNVLGNDKDIEGNTLSVNTTPVAAPTNGTLVLNADGTYTYTPNNNFVGVDKFVYQVCDNGSPSKCDNATVYLTVHPVEPIAIDDINNTFASIPVNGNVLTNDENPNASTLTVTQINGAAFTIGNIITLPSGATVVIIDANGNYTYTPNVTANAAGKDSFTYTVCNNFNQCSEATVNINIIQASLSNTPPNAHNDETETLQGTNVTGSVLGNDFDPDFGQTLTISQINGLAGNIGNPIAIRGGTLTVNANGTYTFVPDANFIGGTSFTYQVCDDGNPQACETATVNITVYPKTVGATNNPPFAHDDVGNGLFNTVVNGNVLANDNDPDGNALTVTANTITTPGVGTFVIDASGNYNFTPVSGYTGPVSFVYQVCDAGGLCDDATVYLTIRSNAPIANDDINNTLINTPVAGFLLINDSNLGAGTPSISFINGLAFTVGTPIVLANGVLTITDDENGGSYVFQPNQGFTGEASFSYSVCTNEIPNYCNDANVTINIFNVPENISTNNPPIAHNDIVETIINTTVTGSVLGNDDDPDAGQTLTVTQLNGISGNIGSPISIIGGTITLNANGTYTFVPNPTFTGTTSFTYQVCDNGSPQACETATVNITIYPKSAVAGNLPPFAQDEAVIVEMNVSFIGTSVLGNDFDPNSPTLPLTFQTTPALDVNNGTLVLNTDGTYTYTPNTGFYGNDQFTYQVCNDAPTNSSCDFATVYITILPRNPNPLPDINNGLMNTPLSGSVITNDQDPQGLTLTVTTTTITTSNGTITFNANGTYIYTPNFGFQGEDVITYQVCNSAGVCANATLTIQIQQQLAGVINNPPIANEDVGQTLANVTLNGNVLSNDFDRDGTAITVTELNGVAGNIGVSTPITGGNLTLNANGTYSFVPNAGFIGTTSFNYTISDGTSTSTATVNITVYPNPGIGNQAPFAQDDAEFAFQNQTITSNPLLANDSDPNGNVISITNINGNSFTVNTPFALPSGGTLTITNASTGAYTYTPATNFTGTDQFTYQICDNGIPVLCDVATVYITVQAEDPTLPPTPRNDLVNTLINTVVSGTVLANDTDPFYLNVGISTVLITAPNPATEGTVVLNIDGTYTFTPITGFVGTVTFVYQAANSAGLTKDATVTINVVEPLQNNNNSPVAQNDYAETFQDVNVSGNVLTNDFDYDFRGSTLTVTQIGGASFVSGSPITLANGALTMNSNGTFTFDPNSGFIGVQTFDYEVCDAGNPIRCVTATATITVYPTTAPNVPFAQNDAVVAYLSTPVTNNILTNDSNLGALTSVTLISGPFNGVLVGPNLSGNYTYTPNPSYSGPDYFVYEICNAGGCSQAMVSLLTINANGPLPIRLLDFSAKNINNQTVQLDWTTATETNNARFEIYRSADANAWQLIGSKDGAGNSNTTKTYRWIDAKPLAGVAYYRLKQIDADGKYSFSNIASVFLGKPTIANLFPNPSVADFTQVNIFSEQAEKIAVEVYDLKGQLLRKIHFNKQVGEQGFEIDLKGLHSGLYLIQVKSFNYFKTFKLVKE